MTSATECEVSSTHRSEVEVRGAPGEVRAEAVRGGPAPPRRGFDPGPGGQDVAVKVRDPQGQTWRVTRRWVPWRRRVKNDLGDGGGPSFGELGDDPISLIIGLLLLVLLIPFLVVSFLVLLELLLLLLLLPFAVLGRVLLGRHWTIEARRGFTAVWEAEAGSWSDSREWIHDVAARIGRGELPPSTLDQGS